eukprot:COSAG01_NODE_2844_length_6989_cov_41.950943_7_plen_104_part_00
MERHRNHPWFAWWRLLRAAHVERRNVDRLEVKTPQRLLIALKEQQRQRASGVVICTLRRKALWLIVVVEQLQLARKGSHAPGDPSDQRAICTGAGGDNGIAKV